MQALQVGKIWKVQIKGVSLQRRVRKIYTKKKKIRMNELRKNYKTFEEGLVDYIGSFMEAERDFGCYAPPNEEEKKRLTERFKTLWDAENCKMEDAVFRYY